MPLVPKIINFIIMGKFLFLILVHFEIENQERVYKKTIIVS